MGDALHLRTGNALRLFAAFFQRFLHPFSTENILVYGFRRQFERDIAQQRIGLVERVHGFGGVQQAFDIPQQKFDFGAVGMAHRVTVAV
ncbi:hypothetical protein U14_00038 [Candidatus Moduliflexus flocculans]|uniref:Uncharacterized protein n=1 Tax=Candidatus Moduliflexus flocculans TaxID=1499966 RepID=A0A0S6VPA8_9BACT|nr:hypothetical protein U14_00038 [Candidatus Moduliflexus flocculans]